MLPTLLIDIMALLHSIEPWQHLLTYCDSYAHNSYSTLLQYIGITGEKTDGF
jgi:hypothetical protein